MTRQIGGHAQAAAILARGSPDAPQGAGIGVGVAMADRQQAGFDIDGGLARAQREDIDRAVKGAVAVFMSAYGAKR